jgi:hypothetical protein
LTDPAGPTKGPQGASSGIGPRGGGLDRWGVYLILTALLVPVLLPEIGPQVAIIDGVNLAALGLFLVAALGRAPRLQAPFLAPVALIAIGSLLALTNARSMSLGLLSIAQDGYLYAWFLLLVNVMDGRGRLKSVRVAWVCAAVGVALLGSVLVTLPGGHQALTDFFGPRGLRATATFANPNYFADYLVLSFFIVLTLSGEVGRIPLFLAGAAIIFALLLTKSNGGAIALASGLIAWMIVRLTGKRVKGGTVWGTAAILAAMAILSWTLVSGFGLGAGPLKDLHEKYFTGRVEHSYESRIRIWSLLRETYTRSPLGIGPGNSRAIVVRVGERERPESFMSKEAHSDYLGYAIERGPIALLGLILLLGAAFGRLIRFARQAASGTSQERWNGAFAAAMFAGLLASSVHSLVIEKLHFRHFWLYLAMLWAITENSRAPESDPRAGRPSPT